MLSFLKNHPFAVETFFEHSLVLTYAVPKEELQRMIPESLSLDVFEDKWAFVAVALVKTKNLRPKGFPAFMGNDFCLIGYRIFVKYINKDGKRLRGLYIIRSETDKKKMSFFGNLFTHYNYATTDISIKQDASFLEVISAGSGLHIEVNTANHQAALPSASPFHDWKEARRFAGPLPFTFTYNNKTREMLIIEGVREHWEPTAVEVIQSKVGFLDHLNLKGLVLANAFIIRDIPYYWKKRKNRNMERIGRKPFQGVTNIVRFNWHFYVIALVLAACLLIAGHYLSGTVETFILIGIALAFLGIFISLAVSFYIYDCSGLYKMAWLDTLHISSGTEIANIHAGFDETSTLLASKFPQAHLAVYDFYDPAKHTEVSVKRARKAYPAYPGTKSVNTTDVFLEPCSLDYIFNILAAHEIRDTEERIVFFSMLRQSLKEGGKIIVVEHLKGFS